MIDYEHDLNPAQYQAATTLEGPLLVIAGAGTGKTRTLVYRLARLVESGVPPSSILLLTFTRKAARQMLDRARILMAHSAAADPHSATGGIPRSYDLAAVQGGTFHSFAYSILRLFQPQGYARNLTVMDSHDITAALQYCREALKAGKGDRSFPKNQTINGLLSKSRNKECVLEEVIRRDASHLEVHAAAIDDVCRAYAAYKRGKNMLDYDDLLFCAEEVLLANPKALAWCRSQHRYLMVDEYQDTNPVQGRIATLVAGRDPATGSLAPECNGNIMVVGDDAQSIYAFRGADVHNILDFPKLFPSCPLIRLEENYRSTQPILDLCNAVQSHATEGFAKRLFTRRESTDAQCAKPAVIRPQSVSSEASLVAARIVELQRQYPDPEIAVLFRAGFHAYGLEIALNKLGIRFQKYGGLRFTDAAHIKDVMSFVRLVQNPLDFTAFSRMAEFTKGIGPKTCHTIYQCALAGDTKGIQKATVRFPDLAADLAFLDAARQQTASPARLVEDVIAHFMPRLQLLYPDDYPYRTQGLEQLSRIASSYSELDLLIADLSLDDPTETESTDEAIVLSTIHSAKGLEWSAVMILDLVEDRFPSRHAQVRPEDYEEERRLMYVACTRAKEVLELYVPASVYDKNKSASITVAASPFVKELQPALYTERQESYVGGLVEKSRTAPSPSHKAERTVAVYAANTLAQPQTRLAHDVPAPAPHDETHAIGNGKAPATPPSACGYCRHRVFGRGKIVQHLPPDRVRVHFPGIGLKVIMSAYLSMDDDPA